MRKIAGWLWLVLPAAAAAQQPMSPEPPRTVAVDATAQVERAPDRATLQLAVETEGETAAVAANRNADAMDAVIAAIRAAGIPRDRIRTTSYQLHPVYARQTQEQPEPRITGYRAMNMVQVEIDSMPRVGAVIDAAIGAGANRVAGLSFGLRDPQEARREALRMAVERARAEAEIVAAAAGQALGPPLTIHTGGYMPPPPPIPMYDRAVVMEARTAPTPVESGNLTVTATVSIVYRLDAR